MDTYPKTKYRFWDLTDKRFVNTCFVDENGRVGYFSGTSIEWVNDIIAQRYTGLKDINGKEIYEGDILHPKSTVFYPDWGNGGAYVNLHGIPTLPLTKQVSDDFKFKVIGNIFENKELLK